MSLCTPCHPLYLLVAGLGVAIANVLPDAIGKEEYILFRDLAKKKLSEEHARIMDELIKEHVLGRNNVKKLIDAKEAYVKGNEVALDEIIKNMEILVKFYPMHIEKEDKHFFIPCMDYFTEQERDAMLTEGWEFDRKLIHEKYQNIVTELERAV